MKYYIPKQHGAWAMLIIPFLFGMLASQPVWLHALLFVCWILVYLFTFPVLQIIRTKRTKRYLKPAIVYGVILLPLLTAFVIMRPELLWFALPMAPLFAINIYFAHKNNERALTNDITAIVQFSLMVYMAYLLGGGTDWMVASELFMISVIYFIGTAFYVKTIIRERNNRRFYYFSVAYHVAFIILIALVSPALLLIPTAVLLLRSIISPRTKINAKQSGIMEIGFSLLMALFVWASFS